jgi:hypothetical protein
MTWHTPHTWADGDVPTAAQLNEWSDDLNVLKVSRDALGRVPAFDSAHFADLTPPPDLAPGLVTGGNTYTVGKQDYGAGPTMRFVVPVGADMWADLGGGVRAGVWVEGTELHWIGEMPTPAPGHNEYRRSGSVIALPGTKVPGSMWIDSAYIFYVDAVGAVRRMAGTAYVLTVRAGAINIYNNAFFYVDATKRIRYLIGTLVPIATTDVPVVWTSPVNVTVASNVITRNVPDNWDGGAISTKQLSGTGSFDFELIETVGPVPPTAYRVAGLTHLAAGYSYTDVNFGWFIDTGGNIYVYENGAQKTFVPAASTAGRPGGIPQVGDKLRVDKVGSVIKYYYKVGATLTLIYTSLTAPTTPLMVKGVVYTNGGTVKGFINGSAWA